MGDFDGFLAPSFVLVQAQLLQAFGRWTSGKGIFLCVSMSAYLSTLSLHLSFCLCLSNKQTETYKNKDTTFYRVAQFWILEICLNTFFFTYLASSWSLGICVPAIQDTLAFFHFPRHSIFLPAWSLYKTFFLLGMYVISLAWPDFHGWKYFLHSSVVSSSSGRMLTHESRGHCCPG